MLKFRSLILNFHASARFSARSKGALSMPFMASNRKLNRVSALISSNNRGLGFDADTMKEYIIVNDQFSAEETLNMSKVLTDELLSNQLTEKFKV